MQNKKFYLFLVFALFFCLASMAASAAEPRDPSAHFFDQTLGDFSEELETARDDGKIGLLLFFEEDDCPFCFRMKQTVLNQPEVQDYFKKYFLIFPIDIEGDVEITDFKGNATTEKEMAFKQYRVRATPVIAFLDLDGNLVKRYTGATRNVDEFMWLGEYMVDGHYANMSFTKFKRQKMNK